MRCEACGKLESCPQCSVSLTFHKQNGTLRCHYCEHTTHLPAKCRACGAPALALEGLGTEKLEETLGVAFPDARIARLDRDVASGRAIESVLAKVRAREVDILVGTQMVTKGHDLPHVTLVGVVNADAALSLPDFRATERAFQLLVQVAGRAGRGDSPGRVLVQTYDPSIPPSLALTARRRRVSSITSCPIASSSVTRRSRASSSFASTHKTKPRARRSRDRSRMRRPRRRADEASVLVLGPAPAPLASLRNRYRFRVMLRSPSAARSAAPPSRSRARIPDIPRTVHVVLDVDPVQLL